MVFPVSTFLDRLLQVWKFVSWSPLYFPLLSPSSFSQFSTLLPPGRCVPSLLLPLTTPCFWFLFLLSPSSPALVPWPPLGRPLRLITSSVWEKYLFVHHLTWLLPICRWSKWETKLDWMTQTCLFAAANKLIAISYCLEVFAEYFFSCIILRSKFDVEAASQCHHLSIVSFPSPDGMSGKWPSPKGLFISAQEARAGISQHNCQDNAALELTVTC